MPPIASLFPLHCRGGSPEPVTFVYRSHYEAVLAKHVKVFDDASVLDYTAAPDLQRALQRVADDPFMSVGGGEGTGRVGLGPQSAAWAEFETLRGRAKPEGAKKSKLDVARHIAQLSAHQSNDFGFQQIFLFDDLWAAAPLALASSLLRYAKGWDSFRGA